MDRGELHKMGVGDNPFKNMKKIPIFAWFESLAPNDRVIAVTTIDSELVDDIVKRSKVGYRI